MKTGAINRFGFPDQNRIHSIEAIEKEYAAEWKWTAAASENPGLTSAPQSAAHQIGDTDASTGQASYSLSTSPQLLALASKFERQGAKVNLSENEDIITLGSQAIISTWSTTRVHAVEFNWLAIGE